MAAVTHADLGTLLVVLAVLSFVLAIYCALRVSIESAIALAVIGVLLLLFS